MRISELMPDELTTYYRAIKSALVQTRVAAPGIIQSFNAERQTCEVKIAIREQLNINGNLSWKEIPLLVDVPVYFPRAGGYCLTIPVKAGDECLVVFADCCIDAWWQSGGIQNQVDKRRHDLSDGFAIVGFTSQARKVTNYSADTIQLRNDAGTDYIEIDGSTVNVIANSVNINGGTVNIGENTTIDGRVFLNHRHSGVDPGSGTSGGVV
jgi:hypothetical protein